MALTARPRLIDYLTMRSGHNTSTRRRGTQLVTLTRDEEKADAVKEIDP